MASRQAARRRWRRSARRRPAPPLHPVRPPHRQHELLAERTPDSIETVHGWRSWLAVEEGGTVRLRSPLYGTLWPVGRETVASCSQPALPAHVAPAERCNCGVYAGSSAALATVPLDLPGAPDDAVVLQPVLGRVALWGRVVECDRGWRAERAYPSCIYVPLGQGTGGRLARARAARRAERVADGLRAYGVPVHVVVGGPGELGVLDEDERRLG